MKTTISFSHRPRHLIAAPYLLWLVWMICLVDLVSAAEPDAAPPGQLYEIASGKYRECCGFAGGQNYQLPNDRQRWIRFDRDPTQGLATLTILDVNLRVAGPVFVCPLGGPLTFDFGLGQVFPDYTVFHTDPGPPPGGAFENYTVSNSVDRIRIDGILGYAGTGCADVPNRFTHSNVVAILTPRPLLTLVNLSPTEGVRLMVQGQAGHTNIVEASEDLTHWTAISTNVMDFSLCPICPFATIQDPPDALRLWRFYRAIEFH